VRQTMTDSHGSYCRNGHTEGMPWLCGQGGGQCSESRDSLAMECTGPRLWTGGRDTCIKDIYGSAALHSACRGNALRSFKALMDRGADIV
jgi:hypothetical protein